jgi:hypothetical protein
MFLRDESRAPASISSLGFNHAPVGGGGGCFRARRRIIGKAKIEWGMRDPDSTDPPGPGRSRPAEIRIFPKNFAFFLLAGIW